LTGRQLARLAPSHLAAGNALWRCFHEWTLFKPDFPERSGVRFRRGCAIRNQAAIRSSKVWFCDIYRTGNRREGAIIAYRCIAPKSVHLGAARASFSVCMTPWWRRRSTFSLLFALIWGTARVETEAVRAAFSRHFVIAEGGHVRRP
jgi:hypothetical protein